MFDQSFDDFTGAQEAKTIEESSASNRRKIKRLAARILKLTKRIERTPDLVEKLEFIGKQNQNLALMNLLIIQR
jgi:hypothetical protein